MENIIKKLPDFTIDQVEKVYVGKPNKCMCGCSGKYTYASMHLIESEKHRGYTIHKDEIDDNRIQKVIDKVKLHESEGIENLSNYIFTIVIGKTQYTIYLMESN